MLLIVYQVKELVAPCFQKLRKRVTSPRPFRLRTQVGLLTREDETFIVHEPISLPILGHEILGMYP